MAGFFKFISQGNMNSKSKSFGFQNIRKILLNGNYRKAYDKFKEIQQVKQKTCK